MPNKGHFWSEEETNDLRLPWEQFCAIHPEISFDAYRHKRRDVPSGEVAPMVEAAKGYIGPSIGFFDFETTYSSQPRLLSAAVADGFGDVEVLTLRGPSRTEQMTCEAGCSHEVTYINCASDQWIDDSFLSMEARTMLERFTIIAGWNSKRFDVPVLNGRLAFHRYPPFRVQMHKDLMYLASGQFMRIGRRSLQSVSEFFSSPHRKTPLSPLLWDRADHGDAEAYDLIVEHNVADVLVTRDVYAHLEPHIQVVHR